MHLNLVHSLLGYSILVGCLEVQVPACSWLQLARFKVLTAASTEDWGLVACGCSSLRDHSASIFRVNQPRIN